MRTGGDALPVEESDERLFAAYVSGDAAAFDRVYERHKGGVFRYLLRHVRDRAIAEELHQDAWLRVIRARDSFGTGSSLAAWVYSIARHRLIDHWRSTRRHRHVSLDDDADPAASVIADTLAGPATLEPYALAVRQEDLSSLHAALSKLPPAQRDAFLLHVEGGLSIAEIAQLTQARDETVKSRLRYAYAKLREPLESSR